MAIRDTDKPEVERLPRHAGHTKVWLGAGALLLACSIILLVLHILNTPAQGIVTQPAEQFTIPNSQRLVAVKGKTVEFQYPDKLQSVKPDSLATGDIEKFLFSYSQHGSWSLAILVKKLPDGTLANDGNYNYRKQNPEQYTEQTRDINGETVSIMTDHGAMHDQVAFLPHGESVAEIALSGGDSAAAESQTIFNSVLSSWRWL